MRHTISTLSLIAATALGCSNLPREVGVPAVHDVVVKSDYEVEVAYNQFWNQDDFCRRQVYFGFKESQPTSVLRVEHCVNSKDGTGYYRAARNLDFNTDGKFEKIQQMDGHMSVGHTQEDYNQECIDRAKPTLWETVTGSND